MYGRKHNKVDSFTMVLRFIAYALNEKEPAAKPTYAIYGSSACFVHGVEFKPADFPGDIDVSTVNLLKARDLLASALKRNIAMFQKVEKLPGSIMVHKYRITPLNGVPIDIDMTSSDEFGLAGTKKEKIQNISVISLIETLQSLFLRNPKRPKDHYAMQMLVQNNLEKLNNSSQEISALANAAFARYLKEVIKIENERQKHLKISIDGADEKSSIVTPLASSPPQSPSSALSSPESPSALSLPESPSALSLPESPSALSPPESPSASSTPESPSQSDSPSVKWHP